MVSTPTERIELLEDALTALLTDLRTVKNDRLHDQTMTWQEMTAWEKVARAMERARQSVQSR